MKTSFKLDSVKESSLKHFSSKGYKMKSKKMEIRVVNGYNSYSSSEDNDYDVEEFVLESSYIFWDRQQIHKVTRQERSLIQVLTVLNFLSITSYLKDFCSFIHIVFQSKAKTLWMRNVSLLNSNNTILHAAA